MSQKITVNTKTNIVVYEVMDGPEFFGRVVRIGPTTIGNLYECATSDSLVQRFLVAVVLWTLLGGTIEHWCKLCRCEPMTLELGIWK